MKLDTNSLAHTQWNCKYHIVFAPKYRRQVIYGKIKQDIGTMLRKLCEYKEVEITEAEACKDHIHMLVSIPPKYSVSQIMGYLKGKSSLMIFEKYANMKYKYGNRHFWCREYYVDTVGRNKKVMEQYIRNQQQEDYADDQLSIKEYIDPFTGKPEKEGKEKSPLRGGRWESCKWQTVRRAFRLSPLTCPKGAVQTTSTAGGYNCISTTIARGGSYIKNRVSTRFFVCIYIITRLSR